MFTGIITHKGEFRGLQKGRREMCLRAPELGGTLGLGDSLAVNGVCLSLIRKDTDLLYFNLSEETLKKTTLGTLKKGDPLNLEPSLTLAAPLGGHLVTGHIDGVGRVQRVTPRSGGKRIAVTFPPELRAFFVPTGSVALDGISLTVASLSASILEVEVIPITLEQTHIALWKPGRTVNIECDIIGKYVYNWAVKS
jgi:riboflavin synthase